MMRKGNRNEGSSDEEGYLKPLKVLGDTSSKLI